MLEIEMRLSTAFYSQIDGQIEYMNQKLKQYLQFFVDYRQKSWLASAEFVVNSKVHLVTKVFLFIANYRRELRMGVDIKKKEKMKNITEFSEKMKRIQKEVKIALKKTQKKIKKPADKRRSKVKVQKRENKVILNIKNLVFKEQLAKKLVDQLYIIEEVVFSNVVKLKLPTTMRICSAVNIS